MTPGKFYITTPIYYPSSQLHIGHAYTTVYCDTLARWHRFKGEDVFFLTGSDEHGQKIERAAQAAGKTPLAYVDEIVATFRALWQRLNISYNDFIRTSEPRHHQVVQAIFKELYEKGDIYKSIYKGWYCTPCESFCTESKLLDGNCPDCGRPVEEVEEESYFFRMSKYAPALLAHIEAHPEFIQPGTRRNEMVSFIRQGLDDLCVSRTTHRWGIPVPIDAGHVIYVWIDALSNYLTAIGYNSDETNFQRWWPADVHVVGKDILRFHSIIWPCILMGLGIDLPKQVYGHGWVVLDSGKMSKSKGNVVDPNQLIDEFGTDAIRYFLLREVAYGQDAKYSKRGLVERINADLANDLGNALHRSLLIRVCSLWKQTERLLNYGDW
jgi:methionyl-tRNA synthetase